MDDCSSFPCPVIPVTYGDVGCARTFSFSVGGKTITATGTSTISCYDALLNAIALVNEKLVEMGLEPSAYLDYFLIDEEGYFFEDESGYLLKGEKSILPEDTTYNLTDEQGVPFSTEDDFTLISQP